MNQKEKHKGAPQRYRLLRVALILAIGVIILALLLISKRNTYQPPSPYSLMTFDIAEARDEIALSWSNGEVGILAMQKWSEFQQGQPTLHVIETLPGDSIVSVDLNPQKDAFVTVSRSSQLTYYEEGQILTMLPDCEAAFYSPGGGLLVLVDHPYKWTNSVSGPAWRNLPPIFYYDRSVQEMKFAVKWDDSVAAVAEKNDASLKWTIKITGATVFPVVKTFDDLPLSARLTMAFHPDGRQLAITTETAILLLDTETGTYQTLPFLEAMPVGPIEYDPTGRWLFFYTSPKHLPGSVSVHAYDLASGQGTPEPVFLASDVRKFQVLQDGIVIGTQYNNLMTFLQWNGEQWEPTATWDVTYP